MDTALEVGAKCGSPPILNSGFDTRLPSRAWGSYFITFFVPFPSRLTGFPARNIIDHYRPIGLLGSVL